jgi:hypothetical protein
LIKYVKSLDGRGLGCDRGDAEAGDTQERLFQLSFNSCLRVVFQGSRLTSDGGSLLVRELDERLGFGRLIEQHLAAPRGKNIQVPLIDLVRQLVGAI